MTRLRLARISLRRAAAVSSALVAAWALALAAAGQAPAAAGPAATVPQSQNLIVNGGAESGDPSLSGYSAVTIPGWQAAGTPTVIRYATPGYPATASGPPGGGSQFFGGGDVTRSSLTQTVDLSAAAAAIDGGGVTYNLDGWLGGYGLDPSSAAVTVTFLSAGGRRHRRPGPSLTWGSRRRGCGR